LAGSSISHCAYCAASLVAAADGAPFLPDEYQVWVASEIARYLAYFDGQRRSDAAAINQNLKATVVVAGGLKPLARIMQVSRNTLRSWMRSKSGMGLEAALRWAWITDMPMTVLLCHQIPAKKFRIRPSRAEWTKPAMPARKTPTTESYLKALAEFLIVHPYAVPTKRMLVQRVGGNKKLPAINAIEVVAALGASQRERRLLRRRQMVWAIVCRVHRAFNWAIDHGLSLSSRNICLGLGRGGDMVSPLGRRYFSVLKLQHTRGRSTPNPRKRVPQDVLEFWAHHGVT